MTRGRRFAASLIGGVALLLLSGAARAGAEDAESARRAAMAILSARSRSSAGMSEADIQRLVRLGPAAIGPTFEMIRTRGVDDQLGASGLEVLSRLPAGPVISHVETEVARSKSPGDAMLALEILAELEDQGVGPSALAVLSALKPMALASPSMQEGIANRTAALIRHSREVGMVFCEAYPDLSPPVQRLVVRTFESAGQEHLLLRLLGPNVTGRELEILGALARLRVLGLESGVTGYLRLRSYLRQSDPHLKVAAAKVAARMRDTDATEDLLTILSREDDRFVREAAAEALRRISGLSMRADALLWERWNEREAAWLEDRLPSLQDVLEGGLAAKSLPALAEIGAHPLHRETLYRIVLPLLQHQSPAVRCAACAALGSLGSRKSLRALISMCNDLEAEVVAAAERALRSISGGTPQPGQDWRRFLNTEAGSFHR